MLFSGSSLRDDSLASDARPCGCGSKPSSIKQAVSSGYLCRDILLYMHTVFNATMAYFANSAFTFRQCSPNYFLTIS